MDYLNGGSMADKIKQSENGMPLEQVRKLFRQLVSALYYCHEVSGIIHRDVKPENIMLNKANEIVLCDFGVSNLFKSENDLIKGSTGTMKFFAPEIVSPEKTKIMRGKKVDIWAAGITLYNMMTKQFPFEAKTIPQMQHILLHEPPKLELVNEHPDLKNLLERIF